MTALDDEGRQLRSGTVTAERTFDLAPEVMFAAYARLALRSRWFRLPGRSLSHELDFRVGGGESARSIFSAPGAGRAEQVEYSSRFWDIVDDRHIVFSYEVVLDGIRRSVSLVTVEFLQGDGTTVLKHTEHYVFMVKTGEGDDDVRHLRGGLQLQLNGLSSVVAMSQC
jgi:uncharacterized protein YndB with AHSA1/START domain